MKHFGAFCLLLMAAVWGGVVLKYVWGWHVVPLGVPPIGILQALGVRLVVTYFRGPGKKDDDKPWSVEGVSDMAFRCIFFDAFALGLGYLYWVIQ